MRTKPVQHESLPARIRDAIGDFASRSAARFAVLVFAGLVGVFTVLFSLPIATTSGEQAPFVDALFTAVSVICVTGLATVDMATFWSPIGHVFVFVGVEIGGHRDWLGSGTVPLIGSARFGRLYGEALRLIGVTGSPVDASDATIAGLVAARAQA